MPLIFFIMAGVVASDDIVLENEYLSLTVAPSLGGVATNLSLKAIPGNQAGPGGLFQEGFGALSPYVPCRRTNETAQSGNGQAFHAYDCEGPNIQGLHVERVVDCVPGEASVRVKWRVENKGAERQWVSPWVRNDVQAGGSVEASDRIDMPTLDGVRPVSRTGYHALSRNWVAVTDPNAAVTVCAVYPADQIHSALGICRDDSLRQCGFQPAFVPRLMKPGDVWETVYRVNAVRGLKHVDFASQEMAVQLDYAPGKIQLLISAVKPLPDVQIFASVVAENQRRWSLDPKTFSADPGRVIRCTFDWTAPAAGLYDFFALFKRGDGTELKLNAGITAPHGGIDTQLVVGAPKNRAMEGWSDAPYALDRAARVRNRACAKLGPALLWVENALEKVFPQDVPEPQPGRTPAVALSLAANEYESFQIVVRTPKETELPRVNWQSGDFKCAETGAVLRGDNLRACNVLYYPVRVPSHFECATGPCPDALPAFKSFTAPEDRSTPVWFTLYAPPKTPPGVYRGTLTVTASGATPVVVPMAITVYDFALPPTPQLKTDFYFWPDKALDACRPLGCKLAMPELAARYTAHAFQHRITLRQESLFPEPGPDFKAKLAQSLPRIQSLLSKGATTLAVPASLLAAPEQLRQLDAFLATHQLDVRAFCPFADSPRPDSWPDVIGRLEAWNQAAPRIPAMATTYGLEPFLAEQAGIWDVHTQVMDTPNNRAVLDRIRAGREVWWYLGQGPARPYANFFIDYAAIEHRILFWQTWALGIRGLHHWGVNYTLPGQDPYVNQLDATPVNGDGLLIYPGPNGPVNSIRIEAIRDGIEDYDYLVLFNERLKKARAAHPDDRAVARAVELFDMKDLIPDLVNYPRDPELLYTKRDAVARAIVELAPLQ